MSIVQLFCNNKYFYQVVFSFTLLLTVSCSQVSPVGEILSGEVRNDVRHVNVALSNYKFEPRTYQFSKGDEVEFQLESDDGVHSFSIQKLDINWVIDSDKSQTRRFIFTDPGKYKLVCLIPPHDSLGMIGTVIVK